MKRRMIKVNFSVNEVYLLLHTIEVSYKRNLYPFKEWPELEKRLFKRYGNMPAYQLFYPKNVQWAIQNVFLDMPHSKVNTKANFSELSDNIFKIISYSLKSHEFKKLVNQTNKYKKNVEKEWKTNEFLVLETIQKLSGLPSKQCKIKVYITHPKLPNGKYLGGEIIGWGNKNRWKNYSTVYIAHEIMHILTWPDNSNIMHALIELLCDNELRILLNKRGKYFDKNVGHAYLSKIERAILPYWKIYKAGRESGTEKRDLIKFSKYLSKKIKAA